MPLHPDMLSEAKHLIPHPPSDSEASLASLGTASQGETPRFARGDKKKRSGRQEWGLGRQGRLGKIRRGLGETKDGSGRDEGRIAPCFARDNKKEGLTGHEGSLV